MPARLIVIGSDPPVVHPLAAFTTIGRDNTSVVFLDDEFVAGDHARIVLTRASQWEIRGVNECLVVVDGARITDSRVLRSGDTFVIGGTHLRFEADEIESSADRHFANVVAAPDPGPPTVWVVPRGNECVVLRRRAGDVFRGGPPQLEELGGVAMPAGAPHVVDVAADMLVFARRGRLTIVRGLVRGPRDERSVEVPGRTKIHALALIDGVVYVGAGTGLNMLGWVDTRGEPVWQRIEVPAGMHSPFKGIDGFAVCGTCMVAVDDLAEPRFFLFYDVSRPRAPWLVDVQQFGSRLVGARVDGVAANGRMMALLTHRYGHSEIELLGLPRLAPHGWLGDVWRLPDGSAAEPVHDWRAVAMLGDTLYIAAGADGVGVVHVPAEPQDVPLTVRFVPVAAEPVIDVCPVDEAHVLVVVLRKRRGLRLWSEGADTRLIEVPSARVEAT